jgi:hypothetical protein
MSTYCMTDESGQVWPAPVFQLWLIQNSLPVWLPSTACMTTPPEWEM